MNRMKLMIRVSIVVAALASAGCKEESGNNAGAGALGGAAGMTTGGVGGAAGMAVTGGVGGMAGMVATGGVGGMAGMVATGGVGGMAGMTASGGAGGMTGGGQVVVTMMPFETGTVTGTVVFSQSGTDVTTIFGLASCPDGRHGVHIHQGASCADVMSQGGHWDMTRGEGIPEVECVQGTGSLMYTRTAGDPTLAWSIGGDAATNILGHVLVVHSAEDPMTRIGCGVIAMP